MLPVVIISILFTTALGGTLCPLPENIYPCSCTNVKFGRTMYTLVNCHHLANTNVLNRIMPVLGSMQIDKFLIFDSFSGVSSYRIDSEALMPTDWLSLLRAKEIEIYNTRLYSCFACQQEMDCKNSATQRFTIIENYTPGNICLMCKKGQVEYSWIGCMSRLKHFHYSHGQITSIGTDMFPVDMPQMRVVNLTRNAISTVAPGAFQKLNKLTTLDLSHNQIENFDFFTTEMNLEFLDLSWNHIKEIDSKQFSHLTQLRQLLLETNAVTGIKEESCRKSSFTNLKFINLKENSLHCDCKIKWMMCFPDADVEGTCDTPEDYENMDIVETYHLLVEECGIEDNRHNYTRRRIGYY